MTLNVRQPKEALLHFDNNIISKLGPADDSPTHENLRLYLEDEDNDHIDNEPFDPESRVPNVDDFEADAYDELLLAKPLLPRENSLVQARIIGHKRDDDGNAVGTFNANPLLNTRVYLVEFEDGHVADYGANIIAEAIYIQVNDDGLNESIFTYIVGRKKNDSVALSEDNFHALESGSNPSHARTTKGWDICVQWLDGTMSWHPMCEINSSFPNALAEYVYSHNLQDEPDSDGGSSMPEKGRDI
jgi:hypothetical protein